MVVVCLLTDKLLAVAAATGVLAAVPGVARRLFWPCHPNCRRCARLLHRQRGHQRQLQVRRAVAACDVWGTKSTGRRDDGLRALAASVAHGGIVLLLRLDLDRQGEHIRASAFSPAQTSALVCSLPPSRLPPSHLLPASRPAPPTSCSSGMPCLPPSTLLLASKGLAARLGACRRQS